MTQARVRRTLHIPTAPRYDICCISQAPRVPLPEAQSRDLGLLHLGPESFGHSRLRQETRPATPRPTPPGTQLYVLDGSKTRMQETKYVFHLGELERKM